MSSKLYRKLRHLFLPRFRSGHSQYVDFVKQHFTVGCRWLDAGGGRRIFHDLEDGERDLVRHSFVVIACDRDLHSLKTHLSIAHRAVGDLTQLPLASGSCDLITCGMVVEHLPDPERCFAEMARVLDDGGKLLVHTVNLWGYPTLLAQLAKVLPFGARRWIISKVTGRQEQDIFPTLYCCNTLSQMRRALERCGLVVEQAACPPSGILFKSIFPLYLLEFLYIRLTAFRLFRGLQAQLLICATKPVTSKIIERPASAAAHRAPTLEPLLQY